MKDQATNREPIIFNGSCNTALFESWVVQYLIKDVKLSQVVIMNNASFYKPQKTRELIESVRCRIIFLPPYFPNLNPNMKILGQYKTTN